MRTAAARVISTMPQLKRQTRTVKLNQDELDIQYHFLAQAVITQAVDDVRTKTERINALLFLYGPGTSLAQYLGIEPSAMRKRIYDMSKVALDEIVVMRPPDEICKPPLFRWKAPCCICSDHGPFLKPYHTWLHWRSKHTEELTDYTAKLLDWVRTGPGISQQDRIEILAVLSRIELEDLTVWVDRAMREEIKSAPRSF